MELEREMFLKANEEFFMLWRNERAVIVGQNQVIENEVDLDFARENGIQVVQRITGGGAVYHDLGNVNYTLVTQQIEKFGDFMAFAQPIFDFLDSIGVKAEHIGKNDMGIDGKKISGNAQCVKNGYILHHGTILFDTDFTILERVLTPNRQKLEKHGIKSVRSRVCNISDYVSMTRTEFWDKIREYFNATEIKCV